MCIRDRCTLALLSPESNNKKSAEILKEFVKVELVTSREKSDFLELIVEDICGRDALSATPTSSSFAIRRERFCFNRFEFLYASKRVSEILSLIENVGIQINIRIRNFFI